MIEQDDPDDDLVELGELACPVCQKVYTMPVYLPERDACCSTDCLKDYDLWLDDQRRSADLAMPPVTELGGEL